MAAAHRIYARALFEAAQEKGRLTEVRDELVDFARATEEVPELAALLTNRELDPRARAGALEDLLGGADELVRNFLLLVAEKGRAAELPEIARELERMVADAEGRIEVELTTAVELSDEETAEIVAQIERAAGRTVEATRKVDPDLIGGLILQAGSYRVDASVRGRLQRLRHDLIRS